MTFWKLLATKSYLHMKDRPDETLFIVRFQFQCECRLLYNNIINFVYLNLTQTCAIRGVNPNYKVRGWVINNWTWIQVKRWTPRAPWRETFIGWGVGAARLWAHYVVKGRSPSEAQKCLGLVLLGPWINISVINILLTKSHLTTDFT